MNTQKNIKLTIITAIAISLSIFVGWSVTQEQEQMTKKSNSYKAIAELPQIDYKTTPISPQETTSYIKKARAF